MININSNYYDGKPEIPLMQGEGVWGTIYFDEKFIPITQDVIPGIYDWYLVSNYGKVYHKYAGRMLKYSITYGNGNPDKPYYSVGLCTENGTISVLIHRLVMACFYPELGSIKQNKDINHKNGITNDNYVSYNDPERGNIEWMSHRDNMLHAYRTGLHQVGEDNVHSKISNETAMQIINLLAENKYTSKEICDIVGGGATIHIVDDIKKKQCWTHLSQGYDFYQRPGRLFTEQDIHNFCKFFQDNYPKPDNLTINDLCRQALIHCGFEPLDRYVETLRKLYKRKYYTNISSQYKF